MRLREGGREVTVDAHHLTGGTHFRTEHRVNGLASARAESLEGQDRCFDRDGATVANRARVPGGKHPARAQRRDRGAHLNERGGLGKLHARCLRCERNRTGGARICFDHVESVGEQGELDVDESAHAHPGSDRLG